MSVAVPKPEAGNRWVVADVHGSLRTLEALVYQTLKLSVHDQLFLLGDLINKGAGSAGVLDLVLQLQARQFAIFPLRGNHEEKLLRAWHAYQQQPAPPAQANFRRRVKSPDLLDGEGLLPSRYVRLLESLPYYYELDRFYLVHAGFNFGSPDPFADCESMLTIRQQGVNPTARTIVHGHQVTSFGTIRQRIRSRSRVIPLDNGCHYGSRFGGVGGWMVRLMKGNVGRLCALNLDSFELVWQPNCDRALS
ncbi:MAG: metallophosphoesterase [Cytophagales bacterium]|nr:metallophosphoesterase [Cytophagales bacterium]